MVATEAWLEDVERRVWQLYRRAKNPELEPQPVEEPLIQKLEGGWNVTLPPAYRGVLLRVGPLGGNGYGLLGPEELAEFNHQAFHHRKTKSRPYLGGVVLISSHGCAMWDEIVTKGQHAGTVWFIDNGKLGDEPLGTFEEYYEGWLTKKEALLGSGPIACMKCSEPMLLDSLKANRCASCKSVQIERAQGQPGAQIDFSAWEKLADTLLSQLVAERAIELSTDEAFSNLAAVLATAVSSAEDSRSFVRNTMHCLMHHDAVADVFIDESELARHLQAVRKTIASNNLL